MRNLFKANLRSFEQYGSGLLAVMDGANPKAECDKAERIDPAGLLLAAVAMQAAMRR